MVRKETTTMKDERKNLQSLLPWKGACLELVQLEVARGVCEGTRGKSNGPIYGGRHAEEQGIAAFAVGNGERVRVCWSEVWSPAMRTVWDGSDGDKLPSILVRHETDLTLIGEDEEA